MISRLDESLGVVFDDGPGSSTWMEKLQARWRGRGSWTQDAVLKRAASAEGAVTPRFLLRVDDFPRWDRGLDGFIRFHSVLREAGVSYLLGVIPRPADDPMAEDGRSERFWTPEEEAVLQDAASHIEIALHGWSHRRGREAPPAEIVGRSGEELRVQIEHGLSRLRRLNLTAQAYIPPFNALDASSLGVLEEFFPVVLGGPESVRWLGRLGSPCRIRGVWFLPSYPPAYGRAGEVTRFVAAVRRKRVPILIPVTLHWAWEERDGFEGVRRLLGALEGANVTLASWLDGRAWR